MVVVCAVSFGWSGPAVARFTEIIHAHPKILCPHAMADALGQLGPFSLDVVQAPVAENTKRASGRIRTKLLVPGGGFDHSSGGETSSPSPVYFTGMACPSPNAGLLNWNVMHLNSSHDATTRPSSELWPGETRYAATAA